MTDPFVLIRLLVLIGVANSAPVFATWLAKDWLDYPIDGGLAFFDGRRLFGASKTLRGVLVSLIFTTLAAPIFGFDWTVGVLVAAGALLGDLAASFTKRRLGLAVHAQAFGLDQVPESLLPLLFLQPSMRLVALDMLILVIVFIALEALLSALLFRLHVRDRPY